MIPTDMAAIRKMVPAFGLQLTRTDVPRLQPDHVLVRVLYAGICGTDLHIYEWNDWASGRITPPVTIGHEFAGYVAAVGERVQSFQIGDPVSAEMHFACGSCRECRTGRNHTCTSVQIGGIDTDGCFAHYVAVPARNAWKLPPSIPLDVGAIMDPLGNAVHAALEWNLAGRTVLVTGCGPIGLAAILVATHAGAARVIATDVSPYRLEMARSFGAVPVHASNAANDVRELLGGQGAEVLLEMSGHPIAISQGLSVLRTGAVASLLGLSDADVLIDLNREVIFKELTIKGVNGRRMFETWYRLEALLGSGMDASKLITHRLPMERFQEAFQLLKEGECGKVLLIMP